MEHKIIVAGIGPGSKDYILPKAWEAIRKAHYLAGGRRALEDYGGKGQETYPITGKLQELALWVSSALMEDDVVVMVSGDPGYYSLLPWLKKHFKGTDITVIPGISSVQAAFSLLQLPWQNAQWLSFHGRKPDEDQLAYVKGKTLAFLTDHQQNPAFIASLLLKTGWPKTARSHALEHISYANQHVRSMTLEEMTRLEGFGESVMIVEG